MIHNGRPDVIVDNVAVPDKYNWPKHPITESVTKEKKNASEQQSSHDLEKQATAVPPRAHDDDQKKSIPESDVEDDDQLEEGDQVQKTGDDGIPQTLTGSETTLTNRKANVGHVSPITVDENEIQKYYSQAVPTLVPDEIVDDEETSRNEPTPADTVSNDKVVEIVQVEDNFAKEAGEVEVEVEVEKDNDEERDVPKEKSSNEANSQSGSSSTPGDNTPADKALMEHKGKSSATSPKGHVYYARKSLPVSPIAMSTQVQSGPLAKASEEQILSGNLAGPSVVVSRLFV